MTIIDAVRIDGVLDNNRTLGVAQSRDDILSNEDFLADGAVLAFSQASLGAGGLNSGIDDNDVILDGQNCIDNSHGVVLIRDVGSSDRKLTCSLGVINLTGSSNIQSITFDQAFNSVRQFGHIVADMNILVLQSDDDLSRNDGQDSFSQVSSVLEGVGGTVELVLTDIGGQPFAVDVDNAGLRQLSQSLADLCQDFGLVGKIFNNAQRLVDSAHQLGNIDGLGQFTAQSIFNQVDQMIQVILQNNITDVVLTVNNNGNIVTVLGIVDVDELTLAVVDNSGIQHIDNHAFLLDDNQTGVVGRNVIGIGDDAVVSIEAGLAVGNIVIKANDYVIGQVLHQVG